MASFSIIFLEGAESRYSVHHSHNYHQYVSTSQKSTRNTGFYFKLLSWRFSDPDNSHGLGRFSLTLKIITSALYIWRLEYTFIISFIGEKDKFLVTFAKRCICNWRTVKVNSNIYVLHLAFRTARQQAILHLSLLAKSGKRTNFCFSLSWLVFNLVSSGLLQDWRTL